MNPTPIAPDRFGWKNGGSIKLFSFVIYSINALLITVLPAYFYLHGFSKTEIGLISSVGPAIGILSNLIWGMASDRFQTIKRILNGVLVGQFIALLIMFQLEPFGAVLILMVIFYFFQTPVNGLNDSQILITVSRTGASYASFRLFGSTGFAFAAVLFGLLLTGQGVDTIAILCLLTVATAVAASLLLPDVRGGMKKASMTGIREVFLSRRFLLFLGLVLFLSIAAKINDSFLSIYLLDLGADQTIIGLSWMVSALSEIPAFLLLSRYGHKYRELPLLGFAAAAFMVRFLLLTLPVSPYAVLGIQLLHSVSYGIFLVTALRYIQLLVPDRFRATGQAVFNITWGAIASLIGGSIGGLIFDNWGGRPLYGFAAAFAFLACIGFFVAGWRESHTRTVR